MENKKVVSEIKNKNKDSVIANYSEDTIKRLKEFENSILEGAEELMNQHKKLQEKSKIEITEGTPINAKFPGKVNIIAKDHSGKVIEINNKNDMEYNTMAFRKEILDEEVKTLETDIKRQDLEFE